MCQMTNNLTPAIITKTLTERAEYFFDETISSSSLELNENIYTTIGNTPHVILNFSESALQQLLYRFNIPLKFYRKCTSPLKKNIFSEFISSRDANNIFRLVSKNKNNKLHNLSVRAVLSPSYSIVDDKWLYPLVMSTLQEGMNYDTLEISDHATRLIAKFPDIASTGLNNNIFTGGIAITNSETGHSSIWIEPIIFMGNTHFTNRASLQSQNIKIRLIHRGEIRRDEIIRLVSQLKEIVQIGIIQLLEAQTSMIASSDVIKQMKETSAFPQRYTNILEEIWAQNQEITRLDAVKQLLHITQDLPLIKRIQIEQSMSKITNVFSSYKNRISRLAKDIATLT